MFTSFNARIVAGLMCCSGGIGLAHSQEVNQETEPLTVIKEWQKGDNLNGDFEASRRVWLASLRRKRGLLNPNENEIFVEPLDMEVNANELPREVLQEFVEKIKKENNEN